MKTADFEYESLLRALRERQPKCVDCARPLEAAATGVKQRQNALGGVEKICDACFCQELGSVMPYDLPSAGMCHVTT